MLFELKKTEVNTVEVKLPAYFKSKYRFYMINENQDLISCSDQSIFLTPCKKLFWESNVTEALLETPSTKEEFREAFELVTKNVFAALGGNIEKLTD